MSKNHKRPVPAQASWGDARFPTNRKKVRGWKTQIKRVERWRSSHLTPDWNHLDVYGFDYVKLHIDPWDRLVRREPPFWLRRVMLHALLDIREAWAEAIKGRSDISYLAVWLFWPHMAGSQVVMGGPRRNYDFAFNPAPDAPLPHELGPELHARLQQLHWSVGLDEWAVDESDVLEDPSLLKTPHTVYDSLAGERLYFIRRGLVWIGKTPQFEENRLPTP